MRGWVDVTGQNDQTRFDRAGNFPVEFVEEIVDGHLRKRTGDEQPFGAARLRWP